jgi:hypothetical protein
LEAERLAPWWKAPPPTQLKGGDLASQFSAAQQGDGDGGAAQQGSRDDFDPAALFAQLARASCRLGGVRFHDARSDRFELTFNSMVR